MVRRDVEAVTELPSHGVSADETGCDNFNTAKVTTPNRALSFLLCILGQTMLNYGTDDVTLTVIKVSARMHKKNEVGN